MYKHITFLTDFGVQDDYAGVCRGVMKQIAPDAQIINITHGIGPMAVTEGALMLARAIPYMPVGVHLAVVDPGVGGARRAVAIRSREGRLFVGPDNGLLTLAAPVEEIEAARAPDEPALPPRARLADVPRPRRLRARRRAPRGRCGVRRPRRGDRPRDARLHRSARADGVDRRHPRAGARSSTASGTSSST